MAIHETTKAATSYDELIGSTVITAVMYNITVTPGTALKRGSVLTADGSLAGTGDTAEYVLAVPLAKDDATATVYVSGMFNREKLIVAEGDTVETHEAQLRDKNIYLTSIHS